LFIAVIEACGGSAQMQQL